MRNRASLLYWQLMAGRAWYEHYQGDVDFADYTAEFLRWHDFLAALPGPPLALIFGSSQGGVSMSAANGTSVNITLSATGGTAPYSWSIIGGTLPAGITLSSASVLSGSSTQSGTHTITVQAADATGGTATQTYALTIEAPASNAITRNADGSVTLRWTTTAGGWYQVEVSDDLVNWTLLGNSVAATTTAMTWTDNGTITGTHPATVSKRFYRVHDWGVFTVNSFTYTDAQRTVTGIFVKPAGTGPFPALIINHGTGGSASGFSLTRANEMSLWGLACIAANLTHIGTEDLETWGYSPENLARNHACLAALSTRSDVNVNKLAMWGHSRGSFASIGIASDLGSRLKALGFTAGGVLENSGIYEGTGLPEASYPILDETSGITAPTIMFHGSGDNVVLSSGSLRLQTLLNTRHRM